MPDARRKTARPATGLSAVLKLFALVALLAVAACATADTNITSVREQIAVSERFLSAGNYREGYRILDSVAAHNPRSKDAALALADAYFRQGAHVKAVGFYEAAIRMGAAGPGTTGLGRVALARNDGATAAIYFERVLSRAPEDIDALNGMGVALDLQLRHTDAQVYYLRTLAVTPSNANAYNNLALSFLLAGDPAGAYAWIAQASRSNVDNRTIRQNLAFAQYMTGDADGALKTAMLDMSADEARSNFELIGRILGR